MFYFGLILGLVICFFAGFFGLAIYWSATANAAIKRNRSKTQTYNIPKRRR